MKRSLLLLAVSTMLLTACERQRTLYKNTYTSPVDFAEGIYKAEHEVFPPDDVEFRGAIVPHHLTATETIASGIEMLKNSHPKKILLLSPDHFHQCPTIICTTFSRYETYFGSVDADADQFSKLTSSSLATVKPDLFVKEHGIFAVVPYIAHTFPGIPVTPIVLSQKIPWRRQKEEILSAIRPLLDADTIVIVSSDFSHYLPLKTAEEKDAKTMQALLSEDLDGLSELENPSQSDCPNCLWTIASLMKKENSFVPTIVKHSNSAVILHQPNLQSTTSHFSIVFAKNNQLSSHDATFAGDVTFTRNDPHELSKSVSDFWNGDGLRVVNLEGPLSESCTPAENSFIFCNRLTAFEKIKDLANQWSVENNHMLDLGIKGKTKTIRLLQSENEVAITPDGTAATGMETYGLTLILNPVPDSASFFAAGDFSKVIHSLTISHTQNPADLFVVFVHGGEEYSFLTPPWVLEKLKQLIDAGADAVVMAHTHVPGDIQWYKNKPIVTGLGNFVFDQYDSVATQTSMMVRLRKEGSRVRIETLLSR